MYDLQKQRCKFKFCVKLGKIFTETFQLFKHAYGDGSLGRSNDISDLIVIVNQLSMTRDQKGIRP